MCRFERQTEMARSVATAGPGHGTWASWVKPVRSKCPEQVDREKGKPGGDRDRTKRRPMAEAVARVADLAIVTSDNPRTEDPECILDDLEPGLRGSSYERIADRRTAIERALEIARPGDMILLAGKGHETYQVVGTERQPFDERLVVRELLQGAT